MISEAGFPGLDIQRQTLTDLEPEIGVLPDPSGGCPVLLGWVVVNTVSGLVVPARCGRNVCSHCLGLNAIRRARAVAFMNPRRSLTLTNIAPVDCSDPWPTVRDNVRKLRQILTRRAVDPGLWGTFVERGSATGMIHAHIAQRGPSPIPKGVLQDAAHRVGAGWSRIEALRGSEDFAAYVGKGFAAYVGKGFAAEGRAENLRLNGGRIGHFSRGYFTRSDGATIGVREAERLAVLAGRSAEVGSWVFRKL